MPAESFENAIRPYNKSMTSLSRYRYSKQIVCWGTERSFRDGEGFLASTREAHISSEDREILELCTPAIYFANVHHYVRVRVRGTQRLEFRRWALSSETSRSNNDG